MKALLKKYYLLLIFAFSISLIYGSHHFIMPALVAPDSSYYPVTLNSSYDEANFYALRANAAYRGQLLIGDVNLIEHKGGPAFLPMLNPLIMGYLGKIFGSIHRGFIVSDFLIPFLIFLILYFLALELVGSRLPALLFSTIFVFVPKIFIYLPPVSSLNLRELFYSVFPIFDAPQSLYFSRFEYPKVTFVFYALAFYFLWRALKSDRKIYLYLSGLSFGSLFYTYLYDWAYFLVGLFIMALIFLIQKNRQALKKIGIIISIGFLVSIFYWFNFWQLNHLPEYNDIVYRIGLEVSHNLRWATVWKSYLRIIVLVILLGWLYRGKNKLIFSYFSGFLLAYFIVVNIQVVLGFNPHPDHWYRSQFLPIALVFLAASYLFYQKYLRDYLRPKYIIYGGWVFIFLFLAQEAYSQYFFGKTGASRYSLPVSYLESYDWLTENSPKFSVVATPAPGTNNELMLYTHNKIFLPSGLNSLASNEEIWQRLMIVDKIFRIPEEILINDARNSIYLFQDFYRSRDFDSHFSGDFNKREIPEPVLAEKRQEYQLLKADPKSLPYQLDYLYFGPREKLMSPSLSLSDNFEKVYDQDDILIYKLK